jgi:hypothetical protein
MTVVRKQAVATAVVWYKGGSGTMVREASEALFCED